MSYLRTVQIFWSQKLQLLKSSVSVPLYNQIVPGPSLPPSPNFFLQTFLEKLLSKQSTFLDQERGSQIKHWKSSSEFLISFNKQQGPLLTIIHSKEENISHATFQCEGTRPRAHTAYLSPHCHSKSCYIAVNPPEGASLALTLEFLLDLHRAAAKADSDP